MNYMFLSEIRALSREKVRYVMWMCLSAARDDSPAAEVSAEKCVSYKVMETWKESGEDATIM